MKIAGIVIAGMLLFPPYHCLGANGLVLQSGYAFIFNIPQHIRSFTEYGETIVTVIPGTIDHSTLIILVIVTIAASALIRLK